MSPSRTPLLASFPLLLLLTALPALAANHSVTVGPGTSFSPSTLNIQAGDTVTWTNAGGFHDVNADNGSFNSGGPSSSAWVFSHTFNSAGNFGYFCQVHGSPTAGMRGVVNVTGGASGDNPGTLGFSLAAYSVNEGAGTATITVQRTGGDDGAVSVQYAVANGTATSGSDYNATSGTLNWADGDDNNETFTVTIRNDTAVEGNETFTVHLANPTGGASLNAQRTSATVTIQDNDSSNPGGAPAAPTVLTAAGQSPSEIQLSWTDNSNNETEFRIERRTLTGAYQQIATVGANVTSFAVSSGLTAGTQYIFRVRAANASGASAYSNEAGAATRVTPAPCVEGPNALCLNNDRFEVKVAWKSSADQGLGSAVPIPSAPDSGLFYFFNAANIELLIKVLNACPLNERFWVFYAATTNVQLTITVTDTQTGVVKVYFNPLNQTAAPVTDINAFATCP
ncbi:MAG TPA: Calx-beta domain-containing protein [Thermoanaerobaculia bacterium]|nr:Calx-beta domain-containing protein [Thermoanaerobaculia bacterium]